MKEIPAIEHQKSEKSWQHVISLLLASSRFSNMSFKRQVSDISQRLLQDQEYSSLTAWGAARASSIARMSGRAHESDQILQDFIIRTAAISRDDPLNTGPLLNALRGDIALSEAENLIRKGELTTAFDKIQNWILNMSKTPSAIERITLRAHQITNGKILRFQGHFKSALSCLKDVLEESNNDTLYEGTGWYRVLVSNISDLYCELHEPESGEQIIRKELGGMMANGTSTIGTGRRLQLALAETLISQTLFSEAEDALQQLAKVYAELSDDVKFEADSQLRMLICQARLHHLQNRWAAALDRWRHALSLTDLPGGRPGLNAALIQCSMAHALENLGRRDDSLSMLEQGRHGLEDEPRRFWIACFNSHWFDYITDLVQTI